MNVQRINFIEELLVNKESVIVLGPRGSGKSYFLKNILLNNLKLKGLKQIQIDLLSEKEFQ